jgi:predicted Zn-dependent protease with MMP-like domain
MSASPRVQARIVRETVVHEIAHHFGISDERLHELGLGDAD